MRPRSRWSSTCEDIAAPAPAAPNTLAQLVPLSESSLALVGSLLTMSIQTLDGESNLAPGESEANAAVAFLSSPGPSVAQSLSRQGGSASTGSDDDGEGEAIEIADEPEAEAAQPPSRAGSAWKRYLLGIDRAAQKPARPKDSRSSSARGRKGTIDVDRAPARRWSCRGFTASRRRRAGPSRADYRPRGRGVWARGADRVVGVGGRRLGRGGPARLVGPADHDTRAQALRARSPRLRRRPRPGAVSLTPGTALVGHDGRGDGRLDSPPD